MNRPVVNEALDAITEFLPRVGGALLLLVGGLLLVRPAGRLLVRFLIAVGLDRLAERFGAHISSPGRASSARSRGSSESSFGSPSRSPSSSRPRQCSASRP